MQSPVRGPRDGEFPMTLLVTDGAGFIGSAVIRILGARTDARVVNVDKLTYAGNLDSLAGAIDPVRFHLEQATSATVRRLRKC